MRALEVVGLMPLAGHRLLPREIAQLGVVHWHDAELVKMVATALGESAGYIGAWHDNTDESGVAFTSRDCGLMQINIPAHDIGTDVELALRTVSPNPAESISVARANVEAAYRLYEQPWEGRPIRRWQPWVAYTTGWATFPAWWTWHQIAGKPVGPWLPTGRYLHRAIAGVANFHLLLQKSLTLAEAVEVARSYAARFGIDPDTVITSLHKHVTEPVIAWKVPGAPKSPPADGVGPRPVANDGH